MQPAFDLKYDPLKTQLLPNDIVPVTP
jgi:hypothetical protein